MLLLLLLHTHVLHLHLHLLLLLLQPLLLLQALAPPHQPHLQQCMASPHLHV